jgi:two-component system KDP operon response regulator KdpE
MCASAADVRNHRDAQTARRTRPLVLVSEDDADTRFLFRTILSLRGYAVVEAADGEESVKLAESAHPDLILMDGGLPRLDGLAATRRIRQLDERRRVPIVFISGHAEPSFDAAAREAGCDEYLVKPLDFDKFRVVLERYLDRKEH